LLGAPIEDNHGNAPLERPFDHQRFVLAASCLVLVVGALRRQAKQHVEIKAVQRRALVMHAQVAPALYRLHHHHSRFQSR
jgi:hypothetical protein